MTLALAPLIRIRAKLELYWCAKWRWMCHNEFTAFSTVYISASRFFFFFFAQHNFHRWIHVYLICVHFFPCICCIKNCSLPFCLQDEIRMECAAKYFLGHWIPEDVTSTTKGGKIYGSCGFLLRSNAWNFTWKLNSYRIECSIPFWLIHFLWPVGACYQFFIRFRRFVYADGREVSNERRTFARVTKVHQSKAAHQHRDIRVVMPKMRMTVAMPKNTRTANIQIKWSGDA